MRRLVLLLPLLVATAWVAYAGAGGVPVERVWRYGLAPAYAPTGETKKVEGIEFVGIGAGTFLMGSNVNGRVPDLLGRICGAVDLPWGDPGKLSDEMPVHRVEFPHGYWIARYELTNELYERFDADHERDRYSPGDRDPVVNVSFEDATAYCAWLAEKTGLPVRLPSEAEWEAACRGGSRSEFCFGDDEAELGQYAWCEESWDGRARDVGTKRANAWGMHDLHGNVWEWCADTWHPGYEGAPADGSSRRMPGVPELFPRRVARGGCWLDRARNCRAAGRMWFEASVEFLARGFRPALGR